MGYQREGCGCRLFVFCSVFIISKRQSHTVGALAICTGLVAQEVMNPVESFFPCMGAFPGHSSVWCAPLPPHSQQSCPACLLLPCGRGRTKPATACGVCKTCAPFPGLSGISCFVPLMRAVPTCSLAAHSLQRTSLLPFFPPFVWFSAEENYPPWELKEMQRMK